MKATIKVGSPCFIKDSGVYRKATVTKIVTTDTVSELKIQYWVDDVETDVSRIFMSKYQVQMDLFDDLDGKEKSEGDSSGEPGIEGEPGKNEKDAEGETD